MRSEQGAPPFCLPGDCPEGPEPPGDCHRERPLDAPDINQLPPSILLKVGLRAPRPPPGPLGGSLCCTPRGGDSLTPGYFKCRGLESAEGLLIAWVSCA